MNRIELSRGTIEYTDTGGSGPVIVLLHGLLMDENLWSETVSRLSGDYRCIVPVLPLGAHRIAMPEGADLSPAGLAALVTEFIERLGLQDITLAGNDTGGALIQLMLERDTVRIGRIALVSCDAFDNFPPGLTGKTVVLTGKLAPRLFGLFMWQMGIPFVRRLPIAFGWLTKRGDKTTAQWVKPVMRHQEIQRDTVRVLRGIGANRDCLIKAAQSLPRFDRPALVVWASGDKVMPPEHGRRLADLLPQGKLVQVDDSYTLIPLDQPVKLAQLLKDFVG